MPMPFSFVFQRSTRLAELSSQLEVGRRRERGSIPSGIGDRDICTSGGIEIPSAFPSAGAIFAMVDAAQNTGPGALAVGLCAAFLLVACGPGDGNSRPPSAHTSPELDIVREQIDAFNRHDVEAMTARVAPDFVWLAVAGDSVTVEARGRDALAEGMRSYFASLPGARSEVEESVVTGPYVAIRERAIWTDRQGEERSRVSLGVYEVRDGLIRRVWYYPAAEAAR